jgi:hypothetical protein
MVRLRWGLAVSLAGSQRQAMPRGSHEGTIQVCMNTRWVLGWLRPCMIMQRSSIETHHGAFRLGFGYDGA